MTNKTLLDDEACLALLRKYKTPDHIVRHSTMVWKVGRVIADGLLRKDYVIDKRLVSSSCLLHDIGKYPSILEGTKYHDVRGKEILEEEGFPDEAHIVGRHVLLKDREGEPLSEKHVVYYSDKRVVHDRLVSLPERFEYLFDTYAKTQQARDWLQKMKDETLNLEDRLFSLLDFEPHDVETLIDKASR